MTLDLHVTVFTLVTWREQRAFDYILLFLCQNVLDSYLNNLWINKGIYLGKNGIKLLQTIPSLSSENFHSFLVDTKIKRNTASLVNYFRRRSSEEDFYKNCTRVLLKLSREIIQLYIDEKHLELLVLLHEVSELQLNYMKKMIPMTFHQIWEEGLTSNLYSLKLCGAGGGGFILGFTANWEKTKAQLKGYSIEKIVL